MRSKITILFLIIIGVHDALSAYSQKINLRAENQSLSSILSDLKAQSGYRFFYSNEVIGQFGNINAEVEESSIAEALDAILANLPLNYEIDNKTIVIKRRKTSPQTVVANLQQAVRGKVVNEEGEPIPGVSVRIKNQTLGTQTDAQGVFEFPRVPSGSVFLFTHVGHEAKEVPLSEIGRSNVVMTELQTEIGAVVIGSGYGIRRSTQPIGSIAGIQADALENRSVQTADQALQARTSGLRLVNTSGQPGGDVNVVIRGVGSINAGTSPLWVVDGVRMETSFRGSQASMNVLQSFNPEDIESIQVLKDAAATAIYGADGANGVVLITTKGGKAGETKFKLATQFGAADQPFNYDAMDGPNFVNAMIESYANRYQDLGTTTFRGTNYGDPREAGRQAAIAAFGDPDEVQTYNWQDAMKQVGIQKRVNLSASGGTDKTLFFVSGGWGSQGGTVLNSQFDRMTLHTNFNHKVNDKLSFDLKTNLAYSKATGQVDGDGSTDGSNWTNSPFHGGVTIRVTSPIYNEDGSYNQDPNDLVGVLYNMVQVLELEKKITRQSQLVGSFGATYTFNDNLSFRSRWNIDHRITRDHRYRDPRINRYAEYGGAVYDRTRLVTSWNTDQVFDYGRSFGAHQVGALFGFEYQRMYREQHGAEGRQLPSALFNTIDATAIPYSVNGTWSEYKRAGVFTQFQYDYARKYFGTASIRYDGHSRFGKDNRWGMFYSIGGAWDMAQEQFLQDVSLIDQMKLRVSFGTTGNSDIENFASRALFGVGDASYNGAPGLRPTQLGNDGLTWEAAKTLDIALDWTLLRGRVYGTFDVFRKDNERLLLERNLPTNSGFTSIMDNVGTVRNQGIEAELGLQIFNKGDFRWTTDFNITYLENEVIDLGGQSSIGNTIHVGQPLNVRWGYFAAGVNPADGRPMWYDKEGNLTYSPSESIDQGIIGNPIPDFYGGLSNTFRYKRLSLETLFHYEFGKDLYSVQGDVFYLQPHRGRVLSNRMWDRWQKPGDITDIPRMYSVSSFPGSGSYFPFSTRNMQDGSFIRLKNVRLNYKVPENWLKQAKIGSLSLFVQAENLYTWTAFDGPDPEVMAQTQSYYPQPRTFIGGFTMDF